MANLPNFPLAEFLSISFTHHIRILENAKEMEERMFYIRYCHNYKPAADEVRSIIKKQYEEELKVQRDNIRLALKDRKNKNRLLANLQIS